MRSGKNKNRDFKTTIINLECSREHLYSRINKRVEEMIEKGLEDEVYNLRHFKDLNTMNTVGYKEKISFIGQKDYQSCHSVMKSYFKEDKFDFELYEKLPKYNSSQVIPEEALKSDAILYFINLPLSANDFLWLEKFPKNMPIWLVALTSNQIEAKDQIEDLKSQISSDFTNKIITFDVNKSEITNIPFSLRKFFISSSKNIENTKKGY